MPNVINEGPSPVASVITPTFGRHDILPHAYNVFSSQSISEIEWIVVDDSEHKSVFMSELNDPRVKYIILDERMSTGEKRNAAVSTARSDVIVQFDDDDYYSPDYIRVMIDSMLAQSADFVKLASFFVYSTIHRQCGYWEQQKTDGIHFVWSANPNVEATTLPQTPEIMDMYLGYGFSYVFKKKVWESAKFPDRFWGQDTPFIRSAIEGGFKIALVNDHAGVCLHILHGGNTSSSFPQYIIPEWVMLKLFPNIDPVFLQT